MKNLLPNGEQLAPETLCYPADHPAREPYHRMGVYIDDAFNRACANCDCDDPELTKYAVLCEIEMDYDKYVLGGPFGIIQLLEQALESKRDNSGQFFDVKRSETLK